MYHLERSKTARGQAVVVLLAVLSFALAGAGLGLWIGHHADLAAIAVNPTLDRTLASDSGPATAAAAPTPPRETDEVNALAARLGAMQTELMRINALGARLVRMSGLDPAEFDFDRPPPQGGPETGPVRDYTIKELANELSGVVGMIQDRQRKLDLIEDVVKDGVRADRALTARATPSIWPVGSGYVTSGFGFRIHPIRKKRIFHEGVDFASPRGTPIVAVADGVVTFSGRRNGYGRMVDIRHTNGLVTRYAHNTANLVKEGETITQGQKIATVGSSGTATGPHVHFEVRRDGRAVDPMRYLDRMPTSRLAADNAIAPRG